MKTEKMNNGRSSSSIDKEREREKNSTGKQKYTGHLYAGRCEETHMERGNTLSAMAHRAESKEKKTWADYQRICR